MPCRVDDTEIPDYEAARRETNKVTRLLCDVLKMIDTLGPFKDPGATDIRKYFSADLLNFIKKHKELDRKRINRMREAQYRKEHRDVFRVITNGKRHLELDFEDKTVRVYYETEAAEVLERLRDIWEDEEMCLTAQFFPLEMHSTDANYFALGWVNGWRLHPLSSEIKGFDRFGLDRIGWE